MMSAAEPLPLDPARARAEEADPPPLKRRSALPLAILGSLGVHLLPLALVLDWTMAPAEIVQPIPVQLVIEQPPPTPEPPPFEPPKRPGRLASDDMGNPEAKPPNAPELKSALDQQAPPPPEQLAMASIEPPPPPPPKPAIKQPAVARPAPNPRPLLHGEVPGPSATRDAYLAYCMTLIRRHFDLLSPAFLAGRRGATELKITVLDDGTIARIAIAARSPHPEVDARIEQVVAAVGRFPPLPQWFQGPQLSLILHVSYPEGL